MEEPRTTKPSRETVELVAVFVFGLTLLCLGFELRQEEQLGFTRDIRLTEVERKLHYYLPDLPEHCGVCHQYVNGREKKNERTEATYKRP